MGLIGCQFFIIHRIADTQQVIPNSNVLHAVIFIVCGVDVAIV